MFNLNTEIRYNKVETEDSFFPIIDSPKNYSFFNVQSSWNMPKVVATTETGKLGYYTEWFNI